MPDLMDANELRDLAELEAVVEKHVESFIEAGRALWEISTRKLYRATYQTFEDYLAGRWSKAHRAIGRSQAYRLIGAAKVMDNLASSTSSPTGEPPVLPTHESQVRPLVGLSPEDQAEAWDAACLMPAEDQPPTAEHVRLSAEAMRQRAWEALSPENQARVREMEARSAAAKEAAKAKQTEARVPYKRILAALACARELVRRIERLPNKVECQHWLALAQKCAAEGERVVGG